ncbi:hypothetical protein [Flavobacterium quisquiliarum]|uniref:Beta-lactamase-inhibitor-like, PepSY-like n=1 Tax=Flavobacterium quisquiliarum TaxID=1834436 RepID=A0ABV8W778_9FLAO|nr:hypothetical protein [Flavobacterium quisquiliarum]MBW1654300.1 hypothetical protein [Flavobacterium quisquiliarum]NWL03343.1 hypothetical protein [Flavobacterium collinsii]
MKKLITLFFCSLLFLSCNQISKSIDETFKTNDSPINRTDHKPVDIQKTQTNTQQKELRENSEHHFLSDVDGLKKAEEELRKLPQYNGKEIFIYSLVYFYDDGRINIKLQHPENPKYIDSYEYKDNRWSEPKPIQLSIRDNIQDQLISLNKIDFANAAKVSAVLNQKSEHIEGAKAPESIYISIRKNQIYWYPTNINGSRERYSIQFNDDGTLKSFEQD